MKLKRLKSVGHNTAHSYLSDVGHIGGIYASAYLHRLALMRGLDTIELDVLNASISQLAQDDAIVISLQGLQAQFMELLQKEGISAEAVKFFKLSINLTSDRMDVVGIQCKPVLIDWNDKIHECAVVNVKYPEPI